MKTATKRTADGQTYMRPLEKRRSRKIWHEIGKSNFKRLHFTDERTNDFDD